MGPTPATESAPATEPDRATEPAGQIVIVLFDIGGVLARFTGLTTLQQLIGSASELDVAAQWLVSPWVRRFEAGGCTEEEFADGLVREMGLPFSPHELLEQFPQWLDSPFDGAEELVRKTRTHVQVGCLSNTNPLHWRTVISHWSLTPLFQYRFLSFELGAVKPDREIYDRVISRLPVSPDRVLFLDDNPPNIVSARAAGLVAEQVIGVAQAHAALDRHGLLH